MILWRLARAPFQQLDGEGTRLNGGRWNSEGHAVVYLASTASLAVLELLVHVDSEDAPTDLVLIEVDVIENAPIPEIAVSDLPNDWTTPDHLECIKRGDEWVTSGDSLLLRVPSSVIPREWNYLMNPAHSDAQHVRIVSVEPFSFDPRLLE